MSKALFLWEAWISTNHNRQRTIRGAPVDRGYDVNLTDNVNVLDDEPGLKHSISS